MQVINLALIKPCEMLSTKTNRKKGWLALSGLVPVSFPKQFLPALHVNSVMHFTLN